MDGLVDLLDLPQTRVRLAIGGDETVDTEVATTRRVRGAEVATVGEVGFPILGGLSYSLVDPIPDEAALELRRSRR